MYTLHNTKKTACVKYVVVNHRKTSLFDMLFIKYDSSYDQKDVKK